MGILPKAPPTTISKDSRFFRALLLGLRGGWPEDLDQIALNKGIHMSMAFEGSTDEGIVDAEVGSDEENWWAALDWVRLIE